MQGSEDAAAAAELHHSERETFTDRGRGITFSSLGKGLVVQALLALQALATNPPPLC